MNKAILIFWFLVLTFGLGLFQSGCQIDPKLEQEKLAKRYCASCHHLPNPASLTKEIWRQSIMRRMSDYYKWTEKSRYRYANKPFYEQSGTIPMTDTIWSQIIAYFENQALDTPQLIQNTNFPEQTSFEVVPVVNLCQGRGITAVQINSKNQEIFAACDSTVIQINKQGEVIKSINSGGLISGIYPADGNNKWILDPGILDPHDSSLGSLKKLNVESDEVEVIWDSLARPVYINPIEDKIIISEFGNEKGKLSIYDAPGSMLRNISALPGAYKTFVFDYDHDGDDEIIAMFAQALEGVYVRALEAESKRFVPILSFGPEWGISDIDTADVNKDGWTDLIIANGDNADYSIIPKAYHGVRVYLNNKEGRFEEIHYHAQHGATQVQTLDANGDSFPDILVGSFFAIDASNRLTLLLHNGDADNVAYTPKGFKESGKGRWMVMEAKDMDGDGDEDAIIGSFEYIDIYKLNNQGDSLPNRTNLILLLNQTK